MKKVWLFTSFGVSLLGLVITLFPRIAAATDLNIDNIISVSTGGSAQLNKAMGILTIIQTTWFQVLDVVAVLILVSGALVLRSKSPDRWSQYFNYLIMIGLAVGSPIIYKIIKELLNTIQ